MQVPEALISLDLEVLVFLLYPNPRAAVPGVNAIGLTTP
jgi:hypothetical protein